MTKRATAIAVIISIVTVGMSTGVLLARASAAPLSFTLRGGSNGPLGTFGAAAVIVSLSAGTTFTLGATYTDSFGLEPFAILAQTQRFESEWTLTWTVSRGDFGGDYRVERLPDITLAHGGHLGELAYSVGFGGAHFLVKPGGLEGVRGTFDVQVATPALPIGSLLALSASTGYHEAVYAAYGGGTLHGAWWGTVQLDVAPTAPLSMTFTYFRQTVTGSSPLLFDAMGPDEYVSGLARLRFGDVTVQHTLTYSLISRAISARVYTLTVQLSPGQGASLGWDGVPQKLSLSYSRAEFGTVSLGWEIPTRLVSLWFSR